MKVKVTKPSGTDKKITTEQPETPDVTEPPSENENPVQTTEPTKKPDVPVGKKSIVVYFSCTDNTKTIADSRTSKEQNDTAARPGISGGLPDLDRYGNVYIGYPIWHGQAPKILYTFVENCSLSGKTVMPFCISASSGIGTSAINLQAVGTSQAVWLAGRRFSGSSLKSDVESWISGLGLQ